MASGNQKIPSEVELVHSSGDVVFFRRKFLAFIRISKVKNSGQRENGARKNV